MQIYERTRNTESENDNITYFAYLKRRYFTLIL